MKQELIGKCRIHCVDWSLCNCYDGRNLAMTKEQLCQHGEISHKLIGLVDFDRYDCANDAMDELGLWYSIPNIDYAKLLKVVKSKFDDSSNLDKNLIFSECMKLTKGQCNPATLSMKIDEMLENTC